MCSTAPGVAFVNDCERASGLYTFLREFAQLRTRPVRDIATYQRDGAAIWVADIPREPGCDCIAWRRPSGEAPDVDNGDPGGVSDAWLELRRPRPRTPAPDLPAAAREWAQHDQVGDSSLDIPELRATIPAEFEDDPPLLLEDHPDVQQAWDEWVEERWWPWAEQDRRDRAIHRVYNDLFAMHRRQQSEGERYEVVFGLGFLSWQPQGHQPVRRHLIAARVDVAFDAESGTLAAYPATDDAGPVLEQEMLDAAHQPPPGEVEGITGDLDDVGEGLWGVGVVDALLNRWVHAASPGGTYNPSLGRPGAPGSDPVVHLAPALILRQRTDHSFVRAFDEIGQLIEDGVPVPEGVARFITPPPDTVPATDDAPGRATASPPDELYFPLPVNDEQRRIAERLQSNRAVLVQGPPGTGKSHTIVNLISHALATGQRVLVTSHAARALEVLRDKISEEVPEIAPLAVVLTGNSRAAIEEMEASVQGILDRVADHGHVQLPLMDFDTPTKPDARLDAARGREARTLAELRVIREEEIYEHDGMFGYGGTLARIADQLRRERETLAWIPDDLPEAAEPPLTTDAFAELVSLLRDEHVAGWAASGWASVRLELLPGVEEFESAVEAERAARSAHHEAKSPGREYDPLEEMTEAKRRELADALGDLDRALEAIERRGMDWARRAVVDILVGVDQAWRQLHGDTLDAARSMSDAAEWLDARPISPEPPDVSALRADAADLLEHLESGKGWGFWVLRAAVVKRALHVRDLRVGGQRCETAETVRDLVGRLDAEIRRGDLRERWAMHHGLASTTFADLAAELRDLGETIGDVFAAAEVKQRLEWMLTFTPDAPVPVWSDRAALRRMRDALDAIEARRRFEQARERIDGIEAELRAMRREPSGGALVLDPVAEEMRVAVEGRNPSAYEQAWRQASANRDLGQRLGRRRDLIAPLREAAPGLADTLSETAHEAKWDERADDFERAWNWRRAWGWVERIASPHAERALRDDLDRARQEIADSLQHLAADRAWDHCLGRMTPHTQSSLVAWKLAVEAVGAGTGKYAAQYRREARVHLNHAQSAIPAWVMPLHRVAETIQPGIEPQFDIAIIDEASQSGPEALLLAWLAKQIVVVGDDEQISPTDLRVRVEDVNGLRERYLADIPFNDAFGRRGGSFFALAELFAGDRIRLREHFRSMPEIIQFSNNLSYANQPLIPLRQYGSDRLEPVVTRHVPDGYQIGTSGTAVNPPEAEAIVAEIVRMCGDPAYEHKTIGVVSLLGNAQARDIEARLVDAIGPEEIERRGIVCGDAYAFQGDERDVMLLGLVSAPSEERPTIRALTDRASKQRFNVAASRARDQMVLFHTPTPNELSTDPDCVRRKLLEYCLNPTVATSDVGEIEVAELEKLAALPGREPGNQPPQFDSWFEVDVCLCIVRRGYRVIPQYEVHGYRIDLVVQGMRGALAVECDGDFWHAERYEADVARQRDLERAGWTFWRVRESVFRRDPDAALEDLWATIEKLGIFPGESAT